MPAELRYLQWDFENKVVIEYERLGECNACGDCCRASVRFETGALLNPNDPHMLSDGISNEGVVHEVRRGNLRRFYRITAIGAVGTDVCSQLTEDNKCAIHEDKGLFRSIWPAAPNQVEPFERCSFDFREVARWSFD